VVTNVKIQILKNLNKHPQIAQQNHERLSKPTLFILSEQFTIHWLAHITVNLRNKCKLLKHTHSTDREMHKTLRLFGRNLQDFSGKHGSDLAASKKESLWITGASLFTGWMFFLLSK